MFGVIVFACFCMSLLWGLLTLAVRYILTLWYGISHSMNWEVRERGEERMGGKGREGRGEESRGEESLTKMRGKCVGGLCECKCACMSWVFINFPKILHFSSAIKPRGEK